MTAFREVHKRLAFRKRKENHSEELYLALKSMVSNFAGWAHDDTQLDALQEAFKVLGKIDEPYDPLGESKND